VEKLPPRATEGSRTGATAGPGETRRRLTVRPARREDVEAVWSLIGEFAAYEKLEGAFVGSPERLAANLFGGAWPLLECLVAEDEGSLVGFAIVIGNYSTFWTRPLMWLEDLFVSASHRGRGVGRALLAAVAALAVERDCPRVDWAVLDWNTKAMDFYEGLGATRQGGWLAYGLEGERLAALASEAGNTPMGGGARASTVQEPPGQDPRRASETG